jgi:hypothetical protein
MNVNVIRFLGATDFPGFLSEEFERILSEAETNGIKVIPLLSDFAVSKNKSLEENKRELIVG